jgi:DNA-binding protein Fis
MREQTEIVAEIIFSKILKRKMETLSTSQTMLLNQAVDDLRRRLIAEALDRNNGNKAAAAKQLGVKRTTLLSMQKKLEAQALELIECVGNGLSWQSRLGYQPLALLGWLIPGDFFQISHKNLVARI